MPYTEQVWNLIARHPLHHQFCYKHCFQYLSFNYLLYLFCISAIPWRCWRCSEMPSPTSPNISGKISFFYIMKSFSRPLVLSSSSVNSNYILTSPLRIVTDFNPTDCDRYLSTSQPLISPTPLLCNDRNREALSVIIHKAD